MTDKIKKVSDSDNYTKLKDLIPDTIADVYPAPNKQFHIYFEGDLYSDVLNALYMNSFYVLEVRNFKEITRLTVKKEGV